MAPDPTPDQPTREEIWETLGKMRVRMWTCINPEHRRVDWVGDVAHCTTCGLTSEHTRHWILLLSSVILRRASRELKDDFPEAAAVLAAQAKEISDGQRPSRPE